MAKASKSKQSSGKGSNYRERRRRLAAQIFFAVIAFILIFSMILTMIRL